MKSLLTVFTGPERWTKGLFAADAEGNPAYITDGQCFCLMGALEYMEQTNQFTIYERYKLDCALRDRLETETDGSLAAYNDAAERTFEDIVNLITEVEASLSAE